MVAPSVLTTEARGAGLEPAMPPPKVTAKTPGTTWFTLTTPPTLLIVLRALSAAAMAVLSAGVPV